MRVDEKGRQCTCCNKYKGWCAYSLLAKSPTGRKAMCKECCQSKYYRKHDPKPKNNPIECKMNPMMKAFLVDRIHLKREAA